MEREYLYKGYHCKTFVPPDVGKQYHHILVVGRSLWTLTGFHDCSSHCNCSMATNYQPHI